MKNSLTRPLAMLAASASLLFAAGCTSPAPENSPYVPEARAVVVQPADLLQELVAEYSGATLGELAINPWGATVKVKEEAWQRSTRHSDDAVDDDVLDGTGSENVVAASAHTAGGIEDFDVDGLVAAYEQAECDVERRFATAVLLPAGGVFHDVWCLDDDGPSERSQSLGGEPLPIVAGMTEETFRQAIDLGIEWHGALSIVSLQQSEDGVVVVAANSVEAPDLEEVSYYRGRDHLTVRLSEDGTMSVYRGSRPQYEGVDPYSVGQPVAPGAADALLPTIEGLFEEHAISWDDLSRLTIEQFRYGWSVEVVTTSGQSDSEDVWLGNA